MVDKLGLKLLELKVEQDIVKRTLELAKKYEGIKEKDKKKIAIRSSAIKDEINTISVNIVKSMGLSKNTVKVGDTWYIVRYITPDAETNIMLCMIEPEDLYIIQRDGRSERELKESELNTLLPGIQDLAGYKKHNEHVITQSDNMLRELAGIVDIPDTIEVEVEPDRPPDTQNIMSNHAGERWIERVLKISKTECKEYLRANYEEVEAAVLEAISHAVLVWKDEDGIEYLFDKSNIMFVRGDNGRIVTIYEVDFGFDKHINRMITMEQIAVISAHGKELEDAKSAWEVDNAHVKSGIHELDSEIAFYLAKVDTLKSKKMTLNSRIEHSGKTVAEVRAKLKVESNKIFKPNEIVSWRYIDGV